MQFQQFLTSLLVGILLIGISKCAEVQEGTKVETIKDESSGDTLTLSTTHKTVGGEEEDVVVVKDADGKYVTTVDVFDEYFIDKPTNSNKCMLRPAAGKQNKTLCYVETKYEGTDLTDAASEECQGRDIYVLNPCDAEKANAAENEAGSGEGRNKRGVRCAYVNIRVLRWQYYCCRRRGLFSCLLWCRRLVYGWIRVYKCYFY